MWELSYTRIREALHRYEECYTHASEMHYTGVGTAIHTYQRSNTQVWDLLYTRIRADFGNTTAYFEKLLQTLGNEPMYEPAKPEFQMDALQATLAHLREAVN